ncbi:DNA repair helicase Rad3 [Halalkaliarchaeum desulfuricum]|uniref:DNA repair helicase Rad3 n=1 Tax=Halalkaliarchaeum desulfuricum TaxID=2055893 RepID=A0A343TLJ8_9EURY|nr:ATP-dependent DNA helicase [Halalkaliarchaeum desulfuricum]AUX09970.1 DNA repair helicase Rad3 [Halalkaliarchaeum desulfuricum]
MSDRSQSPSERSSPEWSQYFGFESPYVNQADAIDAIVSAAEESGFLAMEGPCGTGKTMAALTAAGYLIRETDHYENAIVATPVKQQRRQFVEDLRTVNETLEDPLDGVALVGKRDLCPYGREGSFPEGKSVQERCESLRETTAELVSEDSNLEVTQRYTPSREGTDSPRSADEERWWDPAKARALVDAAQVDPEGGGAPLRTAGRSAPYPSTQPTTPPELVDSGDGRLYCPFEADWYARDKGSPVTFESGDCGVVTTEEFLPDSVGAGVCPHRAMMVLVHHADVVIGNYNHLFDSASRAIVDPVLDERTLVILDEAHRLEDRVRGLLTDTIGYSTIKQAQRDLGVLLERVRQTGRGAETIEEHLAYNDVELEHVDGAREFYGDVLGWLERRVDEEFRDRFDGYASGFAWESPPDDSLEIELRDPAEPEPDEFTRWAETNGYDGDDFRRLSAVGAAVEDALEASGVGREPVCTAVGALFGQWWERDHTEYFREIELERSDLDRRSVEKPWQREYNASLVMYNCMPSDRIKGVFEEFGGGVLMSATLAPLSIFEEVSGLEALERDGDPPRSVSSRTYELPFPEVNRASWIVDVEPFTKRNRGDPRIDNRNATRERYAYVARLIAESHGNVMLCWPNYTEAAWAAARLEAEIEKPVLLDQSTNHEETRELKREFVAGDPSVLVTSTRGTLTEGVDYEGDDLHVCAVFGVPLVNIGSPRVQAVERAYGSRFGEGNAFEYALAIPAVRQVRQALGRVIRGPDERGVRIVVGKRYVPGAIHSVHDYFPESERREFVRMKPEFLPSQFRKFWDE